jgi:hypothetical protein
MNRRVKSCGKDGQKAPLEIAGAISTFSHSFNNNKLDDRDHFLQNAKTSVASLRRLITPSRNADHNQPGILITFIGIRTYNVGPIFKYRTEHFEPFAEVLFGGAHSNFYGNLYKGCTNSGCLVASKSPSNNAFDFIIGGGLDIPVTPRITIRPVEFDYLLTRFGNAFTHGNNNQSNFRYQAGVQFRF